MDVGKLIKTLRKERQLTQEELSEGIMTRTTLASIENRNKDISFEVLLQLLDRLNVQMVEFLFLLKEGKHSFKQALYSEVYSDYYSKGYLSKEVEAKLLDAYQENHDFYYLGVYTQMLGIQLRTQGKLPPEKEEQLMKNVDEVKNHLNRVTNWTHYELALFTNSLYLFDDFYIQAVYKSTVKNMLFRKKLPLFQDDLVIFLLNCINLSLERNQNQLAAYYLSELQEQITRKNQLYEKTMYSFYLAILEIRTGKSEAIETIKKMLDFLELIEEKKLKEMLVSDTEKYVGIKP